MAIREVLGGIVVAGIAGALLSAGLALGQPAKKGPGKSAVKKFYSVLALKQQGAGMVLIGGRPAKSTDFAASFYALSDGLSCTGALVSSRTMLLAAHCVDDGAPISLTYSGASYDGLCTHAPDYPVNKTADWALCLLTREIAGIQFEKVNTDDSRIKVGTELLLTGFGCTKSSGTGGNDGIYRIGEVMVTGTPSGSSNDILTKGAVAVCYGDSGGPAFLYPDQNKRDRILVSVNSRGNIKDTSYLSSTSTKAAKDFLVKWSQSNGVKICGIHSDAANCRTPQ